MPTIFVRLTRTGASRSMRVERGRSKGVIARSANFFDTGDRQLLQLSTKDDSQPFDLDVTAEDAGLYEIGLFTRAEDGTRRIYGGTTRFQQDPHWRGCLVFNEDFHGDNGAGLGANHQTGWTGLVANLIDEWRR